MNINVFVDASTVPRNPGDIGIAFSAHVGNRYVLSWASGGKGTSCYGEILAISFALEVLRPGVADDIMFYTDSQYALKVITGEWPSGVNTWIVDSIKSMIKHLRGIQFDLVAGHSGVPGNEAADFAAHQAGIQCLKDELVPIYLPPLTELKKLRLFESEVVPKLHVLRGSLRDRALYLHKEIRRGKKYLGPFDSSLINESLGQIH